LVEDESASLILNGELNELLNGDMIRLGAPGEVRTHPSSISKSPLDGYGDDKPAGIKHADFDDELQSFEEDRQDHPRCIDLPQNEENDEDYLVDSAHIRDLIVKSVVVTSAD
jgi:hypothetical protein